MEKDANAYKTELYAEAYACPACGGVGWTKHSYHDCRECDGTGERTKEQVEAYFDRMKP